MFELPLTSSADSTELLGCFEQVDINRKQRQALNKLRALVECVAHRLLLLGSNGSAATTATTAIGQDHQEGMKNDVDSDAMESDASAAAMANDDRSARVHRAQDLYRMWHHITAAFDSFSSSSSSSSNSADANVGSDGTSATAAGDAYDATQHCLAEALLDKIAHAVAILTPPTSSSSSASLSSSSSSSSSSSASLHKDDDDQDTDAAAEARELSLLARWVPLVRSELRALLTMRRDGVLGRFEWLDGSLIQVCVVGCGLKHMITAN